MRARRTASVLWAAIVALTITASAAGQSLPPGWNDDDIGAVGLNGSASYSSGTFTVRGAGADIGGYADSFNFANLILSGDGQIIARVASMGNTNKYAKAGVMIRESLTAGSRHVTLDMKPGGGVELLSRKSTGGSTSRTTSGTGRWLKLVRRGSTFKAYVSRDGAAWTSVGSRTVTMAANVWVGLAVCSRKTSVLNTSTFDHVTVGSSDLPPTVAITSPASGATFTAGADITVAASASDTDPTPVAEVEFFANGTSIGIDTTSPYAVSWPNVAAGSYSLTAVATDTANQSGTSKAVLITVEPPSGDEPLVRITSPPSGTTFLTGTKPVVRVAVDDSLTGYPMVSLRIEGPGEPKHYPFQDGRNGIAYLYGLSAGSYSVTAVVRFFGSDRPSVTSEPIRLDVSATPVGDPPPTISLTTTSTTITATASASDATPLALIEIWAGNYGSGNWRLGTSASSPYTVPWPLEVEGDEVGWLIAIATDAAGRATAVNLCTGGC